MRQIKESYEEIEMPLSLRNETLEHIIDRAEQKEKSKTKGHISVKKTVAISLAAAVTLAMAVTAGAAFSGAFHEDTISKYLGDGAVDELHAEEEKTGKVILSGNSVENGYFRITVDAVLSDGDTAVIFVTKERLTDNKLGIEVMDDGAETEWVNPEFEMEDGTMVRSSGFSYDWVTLPEDGVTKWKYEVNGIDPNKGLVMDFADHHLFLNMLDELSEEDKQAVFARSDYDEYHNEQIHPYYVQGLTLTLDVSKNYEPQRFVNDDGREITVTPYRINTDDNELFESFTNVRNRKKKMEFISSDSSQSVGIADYDEDWDANNQAVLNYQIDLDTLVHDFDQVTEIKTDGFGSFRKAADE